MNGNSLRCGTSYLTPFSHPSVTASVFDDGRRLALNIVERWTPDGPKPLAAMACGKTEFDRHLREIDIGHGDTLLVVIDRDRASVEITAGYAGTAPIYIAEDRDRLLGTFDFHALSRRLSQRPLDIEIAAHYLHGSLPYGTRTLLRNISRLTERARAHWHGGGLRLCYPPPAPDLPPGKLRPDVDVVARYRCTLATVMQRALGKDARDWAIELSGGLDSATLALSATNLRRPPIWTYGLEIEGPEVVQQRARRTDLSRRIGSQDYALQASTHGPLSDVARGDWLGPHAEIYAASFDRLLERATAQGVRRMVNGVGGDELLLPHYTESESHPELAPAGPHAENAPSYITHDARQRYTSTFWNVGHAPRTLVPRSTLLSLASRSPVFLRRGIWPVSPFASLEAIRLCRRLPAAWRNHKYLHRAVLDHAGCSSATIHPELPENFHAVLTKALRIQQRALIENLFTHPLLASEGLVDERQLRKAYRCYAEEGHLAGDERFYEVAALELLLRGV